MIKESYNILVVEDEWINAEFIVQLLRSLSQNVIGVASSAKEAFEFVRSNAIDFIFMDINIEGSIDGIRFAQSIKNSYPIPIIYMTAFGDSQTIEEASSTNIYGFIIKPFDAKDIEATLNVAIQRAKLDMNKEKSLENIDTLSLGESYIYNFKDLCLQKRQKRVKLSKNELKLLNLLCQNINALVSIESIYSCVWENKIVSDSTIRDTIARLRRKIAPLELNNVVGMGYILQKA